MRASAGGAGGAGGRGLAPSAGGGAFVASAGACGAGLLKLAREATGVGGATGGAQEGNKADNDTGAAAGGTICVCACGAVKCCSVKVIGAPNAPGIAGGMPKLPGLGGTRPMLGDIASICCGGRGGVPKGIYCCSVPKGVPTGDIGGAMHDRNGLPTEGNKPANAKGEGGGIARCGVGGAAICGEYASPERAMATANDTGTRSPCPTSAGNRGGALGGAGTPGGKSGTGGKFGAKTGGAG